MTRRFTVYKNVSPTSFSGQNQRLMSRVWNNVCEPSHSQLSVSVYVVVPKNVSLTMMNID